jgi:hypothetical protein
MYSAAVPHIDQYSFAGHETFSFRYTWLRKAMEFVSTDPAAFGREDAMVELGVGKNMVRSMRHWALACGVLVEEDKSRGKRLLISDFGQLLLGSNGWDPFLEDQASLWVLHAKLAATPERATTWYWAFNHLSQPEFSRTQLAQWLLAFSSGRQWARVAAASLKRDIDCFIRSYVPAESSRKAASEDTLDSPLVELGLIREFGSKGHYILARGPQPTLPDEVVAWSLGELLKRMDLKESTVSLDRIAFAPGSPGRVFCLSEDALVARLEKLALVTRGDLVFDETAGLRQVLINRRSDDPNEYLARYYNRSSVPRLPGVSR